MTVVRQYGFVGYAFHVKSGPHPWIRFISQQVGYVSCYIPLYTHHIPINNIMLYPQYIPIVYPLLPPNHPTLTIFGLETHRDLGILHFKKPPYDDRHVGMALSPLQCPSSSCRCSALTWRCRRTLPVFERTVFGARKSGTVTCYFSI